MQPQPVSTTLANQPVRPPLPTEFIAQLFARLFSHPTPKFFQILATIIGALGALLFGLNYLEKDLTQQGQAVPDWLHWAELITQGMLDVSGLIVAKATIQTPSTPPLAIDTPEPTVKELAARIAQLEAEKAATLPPTPVQP